MAPAEIARHAWETWMLQKSPNTVAARNADLTVLGRWLGLDDGPELPMRAAFAVLEGPAKQRHLLCRSKIEQWAEDMKHAGLAAPTIGRRLSTMRSWLRALQDYGLQWSLRLPGPRYDPYNRAEGPEPALVEETIAKLEKPAKTDPRAARDRALIVLLYDQALRRMSAHSLDMEHIDFAKQRVFIEVKGFPDRKHRTITKRTVVALRAWIKHRSYARGPVFCSVRGNEIRPKKRLHKNHLAALIGRRKLGASQGLRHAAATGLRDRGADPFLVQALLGHRHIGTTQIYLDQRGDAPGRASRVLAGEEEIDE